MAVGIIAERDRTVTRRSVLDGGSRWLTRMR
jgi:hypothetical protein